MSKVTTAALCLLATGLAFSCGGSNGDEDAGGGHGASSSSSSSGGGSGGGGPSGTANAPGQTLDTCDATAVVPGCTGETYEGENIPLDLFVMFDVSCSMSCPLSTTGQRGQCCPGGPEPRIDPTRQAMLEFLADPGSAGINVGIGYFGHMQIGSTSCEPADYATAAVPIAPLPGNDQAMTDSLNAATPTGETPTHAAISGACQYVNEWHAGHPGHASAILLVTDGVPEVNDTQTCDSSVDEAAAAATACLNGDVQVPTYVLGIGLALDNLNAIAAAGGTDHAYLVDGTQGSVLEALNSIRADALIPCDLTIPAPPPGEVINYNEINIGICDASGQVVVTYFVEGEPGCDPEGGGWYYDPAPPAEPEQIRLCPATCNVVSVTGAELFFTIGCQTQTEVPQ